MYFEVPVKSRGACIADWHKMTLSAQRFSNGNFLRFKRAGNNETTNEIPAASATWQSMSSPM